MGADWRACTGGQGSDAPWYFADVLPTLADLAGAAAPKKIDGVSVLPTLLGKPQDLSQRMLYWEQYSGGFQQAVALGPVEGAPQGGRHDGAIRSGGGPGREAQRRGGAPRGGAASGGLPEGSPQRLAALASDSRRPEADPLNQATCCSWGQTSRSVRGSRTDREVCPHEQQVAPALG